MHIGFVEIRNFRKLQSVRIDFSNTTTLLVGANNSGKTSAMLALHHFLVDHADFSTNDFTLPRWTAVNEIGTAWELPNKEDNTKNLALSDWDLLLPSLDVWLEVGDHELHYVRDLLPTLDWAGGLIGVRLRFEPKDVNALRNEYLTARNAALETRQLGAKAKNNGEYTLTLWPNDMRTFLDRELGELFTVRTYLLDPAKQTAPLHGVASPQPLPIESDPIDTNPLHRLIRIDNISAQRGLAPTGPTMQDMESSDARPSRGGRLSEQLRSYYSKHLDPSKNPEPADLDALQAIESAQKAFDGRLEIGFAKAIAELEDLNYPGVVNPQLKLATRLRPTDGLGHQAAVQYVVVAETGRILPTPLRLPEEYNGLGYQNLISMVFQLMAFRDARMCVGKAGKSASNVNTDGAALRPLHLVLIEEPEAHLHCQVQQIFVRKAYDVLRNHENLRDDVALQTQLVVSTHSSHVAHEVDFSCLRYFRRLPAAKGCEVPCTAVINLSNVFGDLDDTKRFVKRYLLTTHADLFFADAAILVEGPAERLLVPHFIKKHFPHLDRCYISLLEIGGSHAHRLRPLIEELGLTTLIITDLDSAEAAGHHEATAPKRTANQITRNTTLVDWHPKVKSVDDLLDLADDKKVLAYEEQGFLIRIAYQIPITVTPDGGAPTEALATTLEDSLVFENLAMFKALDLKGPINKVRKLIEANPQPTALSEALNTTLARFAKAEFALDLLLLKEPKELSVPRYIHDGLSWLQTQLDNKKSEVLATALQTQP
ncbi:MAG: ATPase domain protein [Phycisphaerales bacterium]|nr:ATPase domain protein [Phycisphaerales bacterium]